MNYIDIKKRIESIVSTYISSPSSTSALVLLTECAPLLVELREIVGKDNEEYIVTSTYVANFALRMVVKSVNEAQRKPQLTSLYGDKDYLPNLKNAVKEACKVMKNIEVLDIESSFKQEAFLPNNKTLFNMASQLGLYTADITPTIDLQSETEYYNNCSTAQDYYNYRKKYPKGKFLDEALAKAKKMESKERTGKIVKWTIISVLLAAFFGGIAYLIVTADDRKFESVPKTKSGYNTYLSYYPSGKHVDECLTELYSIYENEGLNQLLEFGNKYSSSEQGEKAIKRVNAVVDSLYEVANKNNTIQGWDSFIASVPSGMTKDASARKQKIYQSLYDKAKKKNTIQGWNEYKSKVPDSEARDADIQIENLQWKSEATAWKKATSGNSISLFEKYLSFHPNGSHASAARKKIIDLKVAAIGAGDHGSLPSMDKTSWGYGSSSTITVDNDTQYTLTLMYSGSSQSKEIKISPRGTKSFTLPNGEYRIAASVNATNVRSFYGRENLTGGTYSASYYISTTRY